MLSKIFPRFWQTSKAVSGLYFNYNVFTRYRNTNLYRVISRLTSFNIYTLKIFSLQASTTSYSAQKHLTQTLVIE